MKVRFLVTLLCIVGLMFAFVAPSAEAQTGAGWFWVEDDLWVRDDVQVVGDTVLTGNLNVSGTPTLATLTVAGASSLVGAVTTTGAATVGTNLVVAGNATVTGTSTLVGAVSAAGQVDVGTNLVVQNDLRIDGEAVTVTQDGIITPTSSYMEISSAGTVGTDSIAAGTEGDILIMVNVGSQTIVISDTGTLKLSGNLTLGASDSVILIADGTNWVELSTSNN